MPLIRIASFGLLMMVSGCQVISVGSSQLRAVLSVFSSDSNTSGDSVWAVEFGGYTAFVQPIALESSTVFVNDKDAVSFDGWLITKVSGLNSFTPAWEIYDSGNERFFAADGQVVMTHQCDQWLKKSVEFGVRFEQHCSSESAYTNTILVNNLGQITDVEQVVDSSLMALRLRFNN